jgi:hypothetical protein
MTRGQINSCGRINPLIILLGSDYQWSNSHWSPQTETIVLFNTLPRRISTNSFLVTTLSKRGAATLMVLLSYFKHRLQFSNSSRILGIISGFESRALFYYYCQIAGDWPGPIVINALRNGFRDPGDLVHNSWSFCNRISMACQRLISVVWHLMRFDITRVLSIALLLLITHLQFSDMRSSRKYLGPCQRNSEHKSYDWFKNHKNSKL